MKTAFTAVAVCALSVLTAPVASSTPGRCTVSVPYAAGTGGYASYRIPAVIKAADGSVLAFAEGRHGGTADSGDIDVVLRRSADGGCTWSPTQVVADGDGNTRGNPAPALDPATGRIVLVTSYNSGAVTEKQIMQGTVAPEQSRRVFVQTSDDDGRTFGAPREITAETKPDGWRWYATMRPVVLRGGPHAGRIVVPANHSIAPPAGSADLGTEAKYYGGHDIYSDDHGVTWHIGYVDDNPDGYVNVNETTVAQLEDGRLYFNARDQNGTAPGNRVDAYSSDGGTTLDAPFAPQDTLAGPVVAGSVLQPRERHAPLLYAGPADPSARAAMTIRASVDDGVTWTAVQAVSGLPAAYSDLVQADADTIGLLYETGPASPYETITFRRLPLSALRP
ncbi:exo-alpha-sialidase [Amycolatopsis rhizosphaerae]|uniref:exo-alpha-sialidase n=1 Tax=Amycolatopsis rhizosphaerae TaxID=2053003 RepID=A0A558AKE1_9PSEU|nr:sialidase family protein [Amycolatopsis rhizosphaerae]TVT24671.1 exo-alpha-sialidase [Amycolatopsis rhizosphaerae]